MEHQENATDRVPAGPMPRFRCGYITLAGRPNVGKSTLLNALVGEHLSIVSRKAQTTRERVAGLVTTDTYQLIFLDGPGLLEAEHALQESMRLAADEAIQEADVVVFVVDGTRPDTLPSHDLSATVRKRGVPMLICLNKADRTSDTDRLALLEEAKDLGHDALAVSAAAGSGLDKLVEWVVERLPESPPLYPAEDTATQPVRFFAEEYVRETCMDLFREEVPYSIACRVEEFREDRDPVYVRITIYVERESQKGIVIGRRGSSIKRVGELSRRKIESLIDRHIYLDLRVKVLPGWPRKRERLRQLGFRVPPKSPES